MSDLISRSELLKHRRRVVEYDEAGFSMDYFAVPVEEINNAPTVDAVPVVRCLYCKHRKITMFSGKTYCDFWLKSVELDDFCSIGERRVNK